MGLWYYDLALQDWMWVSSSYYPWMYDAAEGWLYFVRDTVTPNREFYYYGASEPVLEGEGI